MLSQAELRKSAADQLPTVTQVAQQFVRCATANDISPLGDGNINDTYLVRTESPFVLQRLNTQVFPSPDQVMDNLCQFVNHAHQRLVDTPLNRRWEVPTVLKTADSQHHWIDQQGHIWRGLSFVHSTTTFNTIQDLHHAAEIGHGLGCFHCLLSDLPTAQLNDTLPGFHVTPHYLRQYDTVLANTAPARIASLTPEEQHCCTLITEHRHRLSILEDAKTDGHLPLRPIHGDPKINNILIDTTTQKAASLIDLDTIKPGLVHYDIGDCLRSSCNALGEETQNWEQVTFDVALCTTVLEGYLSRVSRFLNPVEYDYIYAAIWLITFELGLRFFTDHLAGNLYFKVQHSAHNLQRALVQFRLADSVFAQKRSIQAAIDQLKARYCSEFRQTTQKYLVNAKR